MLDFLLILLTFIALPKGRAFPLSKINSVAQKVPDGYLLSNQLKTFDGTDSKLTEYFADDFGSQGKTPPQPQTYHPYRNP